MAKLVLLVVAAAWAAVLIPPMLRSRVDNRPNSSVTDFRRQLNRLQSTAAPSRGSARAIGRPLAQSSSPFQRQAAGGRPHQPPRDASLNGGGTATRQRSAITRTAQTIDTTRYRVHGDASGSQPRPLHQDVERPDQQRRQSSDQRSDKRRRPQAQERAVDSAVAVKRRRMNILFVLIVTGASTMFLAATTSSTLMLYLFALSFLSLCGYVYLLAQIRVREDASWNNGWLEQR